MSVFAMLTESDAVAVSRSAHRRSAFLAQDGVVLSSIISTLHDLQLLPVNVESAWTVEDQLQPFSRSGFGSLRVMLRALHAQGWLTGFPVGDATSRPLRWTDVGQAAAGHFCEYAAVGRFLRHFSSTREDAWPNQWTPAALSDFRSLVDRARRRWDTDCLPSDQGEIVRAHLDGALAVPLVLSEPGVGLPPEAAEVLDLLGWNADRPTNYAATLGMSASYLPLFAQLPDILRGGAIIRPDNGGPERHVLRGLNVNASAAAHERYFEDSLSTILPLFDRPALDSQPTFIADVGCGNGRWLAQLYDAIRTRTLRGRALSTHPLTMIGVDSNQAALNEADRLLGDRGIPVHLVLGGVEDPDQIAAALAELGLEMVDGLHIRSFIDHDRAWPSQADEHVPDVRETGAYVDAEGRPLSEKAIENDLVEHLQRWVPHVHRHGLVVLEAHSVAPTVVSSNLGHLHSVAFDTYHGLSHQYPIDYGRWLHSCRRAGLRATANGNRQYPASRSFTAVSLTRFLPALGDSDA
jgi:hypothetical protein